MAYYINHIIQEHETLQDIATQKLNDVSRWTEIVSLNNLDYPYIVASNQEVLKNPEHLVTYGDKIKLPNVNSSDNIEYKSLNNQGKKEIYDMSLGMDLALDVNDNNALRNGIAYLNYDRNTQDLKTNSGILNVAQSLSMRLRTNYGTLPYHPYYGSRLVEYIGEPITQELTLDIQDEIKRTCYTDPRVSDVDITEFYVSGENFICVVHVVVLDNESAFNLFVESAQQSTSVTSDLED